MRLMTPKEAKDEAIRRAGSAYALAKSIGISPQAVYGWPDHVPSKRVPQVEEVTGVSRHDLDPTTYPRQGAAV
jgi:DNA-binding transcriptional regulator YdaS (Cro superfamily)